MYDNVERSDDKRGHSLITFFTASKSPDHLQTRAYEIEFIREFRQNIVICVIGIKGMKGMIRTGGMIRMTRSF